MLPALLHPTEYHTQVPLPPIQHHLTAILASTWIKAMQTHDGLSISHGGIRTGLRQDSHSLHSGAVFRQKRGADELPHPAYIYKHWFSFQLQHTSHPDEPYRKMTEPCHAAPIFTWRASCVRLRQRLLLPNANTIKWGDKFWQRLEPRNRASPSKCVWEEASSTNDSNI